MSLERLSAEIHDDPAEKGYEGMTNTQILTALYTKDIPRYKIITSAELLAWAGANERLLKLEEAAADHASRAIKNVCKIAVEMLKRDSTQLDLNLSDRAQMAGALVLGGVLAQEDIDALYSFATYNISRADVLGLPLNYMEGDVEWARNH